MEAAPRLGGVECVGDAVLLLIDLYLAAATDLQHRHTAAELGQPLLRMRMPCSALKRREHSQHEVVMNGKHYLADYLFHTLYHKTSSCRKTSNCRRKEDHHAA